MYKWIIFDVDGTLIETSVSNIIGLKITMKEKYNKEYLDDELRKYMGIPGDEALRKLGVKEDEINSVWNFWEDNVRKNAHKNYIFQGIKEMLEELKNKYSLAIVTSKTHKQLKDDFIDKGLSKYFKLWICKEDTTCHKPNPEPLLKALEKSNAKVEEAIYIGDAFVDYKAATAINMSFAQFRFMDKYEEIDCPLIFKNSKDVLTYFNISK